MHRQHGNPGVGTAQLVDLTVWFDPWQERLENFLLQS